jgi:hypothetical protein
MTWYLGVALEVVSTMSGTVGKQLIRLSELRKTSNPGFAKGAFYGGLVVNTVCGPALDMAAYSFAPQSLIAPFGGLDVVWNALSAPYLLQETLTLRRALGCSFICVGTAMSGVFGSHTDVVYTVEYLEDLLISWRVLFYFLIFICWFLFNVLVLQKRSKGSFLRGVSLGVTAGTIAGNMFCVKAAVEIIQYSIDEDTGEPWTHWLPYVILVGAAFFAISNVKYMTTGLQEYEALFMVTVYEGSMIVSNCISGSLVLLDLRRFEAWRIAAYFCSVLIIIFGMGVVCSNEIMNKSSLAAGKASIEPESMKELQSIGKLTSITREPANSTMDGIDIEGMDTPRSKASAPKAISDVEPGSENFSEKSCTSPKKGLAGMLSSPSSKGSRTPGLEASSVGKHLDKTPLRDLEDLDEAGDAGDNQSQAEI